MSPPLSPHRGGRLATSAIILATLSIGALQADPVINEIHYNNDVNYVLNEFIELYNPGETEVDLSGWQLGGGVTFTFPAPTTIGAGEFLVVAKDPPTIQREFDLTALGPFDGGLSGDGEEIELLDAAGVRIDRVNYDVDFPWPIRADGGGSSMELINASLDNNLGSSWRSSSTATGELAPPTPGTVNTVASDTAPPNIRQVAHTPEQPSENEPVVITAKVTDPEGVDVVELQYQVVPPGRYIPAFLAKPHQDLLNNPTGPRDPNPNYQRGWISVPMVDDGSGVDAVAGDDIYSADLGGRSNRTLMRYRIRVADPDEEVTVPFPDDETLNFAYFVYNGIPDFVANTRSVTRTVPYTHSAETLNTLPAYHLLTTGSNYDQCVAYSGNQIPRDNLDARSEFNWSGTFVYNGKVYDNIKYRLRQRNARYSGNGKRSFRFRFNRGHYVQFHDMWGNPYPTKWRTLNSHKMDARGGPNFGLHEAANSTLWNLTGTPAPYTHWFHFRVIKGPREAPDITNGQHLGDFHGFLLGMEDYDSRFLETHDLPDGNLYKLKSGVTNGLNVQRYQAPNSVTDGSDYSNILFNLRPSKPDTWLRRTVNWDSYYHYHAIVDAVRHYDVQPNLTEHLKNRAYYFRPDGSRYGLLNVLPWDSDTSWGPNWNGGVDFAYDAMRNKAAFNLEYRNVVREIRDLLWQRPQIYDLIDLLEDKIAPFQLADRDRWTGSPSSAGSQTDGPVSDRTRHMKNFAFVGGSWTGGNDGNMAAISRDNGISGQQGRDDYLDALASDNDIPETPTLNDLSAPNHPSNELRFASSPFSDSTGSFAAMEYRLAEVAPYAGDGQPFPFEWTATWESGELTTFTAEVRPPPSAVRGGRTYRARVRHQDDTGRWSHWSAPVEFAVTEPDIELLRQSLVISEIMYNPAGSEENTEFVELRNIGSTPLDLTDVRFTKGIDFDFAPGTMLNPGEYLLVVNDLAAFEAEYGTGLPIAGEYKDQDENNLSNGGERIKLAFGALAIHEFVYSDMVPWPTGADGDGYSLVLAHTHDHASVDPLDPLGHGIDTNWRSSSTPGGTPAATDSRNFAGPDPTADEDQDDLSAFLEHALGSDDTDPGSGPGLFWASRDGDRVTFVYRRNLRADDVAYTVGVSTNLLTWSPDASLLSETPNGDGTSTVTWIANTLIPENEQLFMRLRTEQVSPLP